MSTPKQCRSNCLRAVAAALIAVAAACGGASPPASDADGAAARDSGAASEAATTHDGSNTGGDGGGGGGGAAGSGGGGGGSVSTGVDGGARDATTSDAGAGAGGGRADAGLPGADGAAGTGATDARAPADAAAAVGPEPSASARAVCSGTDPISCHFGGQPGNYDVTVVLGGAAAANTIVQAERARVMLPPVATAAGERRRFTFTVNVRQPEGEPIQNVPAGTAGLDVYFLGTGGMPPRLDGIGYAPAAAPLMIYVAGDSTVCDQPPPDYGGWGQQLPQFFDYPVSVANYADSGESSGSFLNSGSLFGAINTRLRANDWVLIQFGHNDKEVTAAAFHDNLTRMVTAVKAKNAFPVLVTPVARATFSGGVLTTQHVNGTGANLPQIIKQVGTEQNVPVLDLLARTVTWLDELGSRGWQPYHALGTDATHTNPAGAAVEAGFVRDLIRAANLTPLVGRLR